MVAPLKELQPGPGGMTISPTLLADNAVLDDVVADIDRRTSNGKTLPRLLNSAAFVEGFVPPDYLLDGVLQRRFIYSLTGATGAGKTAIALLLAAHVAKGKSLAGRDVARGRVLYLAGENPDDILMRWTVMSQLVNFGGREIGFDVYKMDVWFVPGRFAISELFDILREEVERIGGVVLVIVDTSAAYFAGEDENSNPAMGAHARDLRKLTTLPGEPCVLVPCHPVKTARTENLVPRGGGAFLAEVDGNLTCAKHGQIVELNTQGKFRGPEFELIQFKLRTVTTEKLTDSRGRPIPAIIAEPLTEHEREQVEQAQHREEDDLLLALDQHPEKSIRALAVTLGWTTRTGQPKSSKVHRCLRTLEKHKLVQKGRQRWEITKLGQAEANAIRDHGQKND